MPIIISGMEQKMIQASHVPKVASGRKKHAFNIILDLVTQIFNNKSESRT